MIELAILVLFIVLITGVILVYKKYVKVVNVINDEQNRKYKEISELISSNNENIKDNEKDTQDILNRDNVDVNELENIINDNNKRVKTNKNNLNKYNFEDLNKIFSYDNGFIIGNSSSQINIGDNNIRLNVENPSKIRVCNEQNECTGSNSLGTLQSVLNNYPLLQNDSQAQTTITTQTTPTTQTIPTTQNAQNSQNAQNALTNQTTSNNIVVATNNTTSSSESGIYFDKTTNIFYSNIPIFNITIKYEPTNFSDPILNNSNIEILNTEYEVISEATGEIIFTTIYSKEPNKRYTGEIFKIINFSNLELLTMSINFAYLKSEYIINF